MRETRYPTIRVKDWLEYAWLFLTNHSFRAHPHKRKAFYEHRLAHQNHRLRF